jgi:hypothetical protein
MRTKDIEVLLVAAEKEPQVEFPYLALVVKSDALITSAQGHASRLLRGAEPAGRLQAQPPADILGHRRLRLASSPGQGGLDT